MASTASNVCLIRVRSLRRTLDRVRPRSSNSFDYAVQVAEAIESYSQPITVDTAANEAIIDGSIRLGDYDSVVWIRGRVVRGRHV